MNQIYSDSLLDPLGSVENSPSDAAALSVSRFALRDPPNAALHGAVVPLHPMS